MSTKFSGWLLTELEKRDMSQAQLARATGLTRQAISYYLSEKSKRPDDEALAQIARVFRVSREEVYRAAGILSESDSNSKIIEQIKYFIDNVPEEEKANILDYAKHRFEVNEQREKNGSKQPRKKPATAK